MAETFAPEWEHQYVLTWSGRWHIADVHMPTLFSGARRALCGAYGYTRDNVPRYHDKLQDIRHGNTQAPHCKKCEKQNINRKA